MQSDQLFTGIMKSFFLQHLIRPLCFSECSCLCLGWSKPFNHYFQVLQHTHTHTQNEITSLLLNKQKHRDLWVRI